MKYKNPGQIKFEGVIHQQEGGGAFVYFPHDVEKLYGVKGRVPVKVTFDGIPYRGSMVKMGSDRHILLILKEIRERLKKGRGDKLRVTVDLDDAPRVVTLSRDVEAACKRAGVLERYRALSYSHQREYALWIEAAKQAETRQRRIEKSIAALRGQKPLKS
ncbi:MAG: YdeI/OmpD-associated family protein [Candidatus Aminicenantales bacterium]